MNKKKDASYLDFKKRFEKALKLRKAHKYDEAISIFTELAKENPNDIATFGFLGATFFDKGDFINSEKALRSAIQLNEKSERASIQLFHTLWNAGKQDEAMEEMKRFCTLQYSEEYALILKEINENLSESE